MTTPPIKISDEAIEAATHAIHDLECAWANCTENLTTEGRYGRWARAAVEAVAPLIAAPAALAERVKIVDEIRRHAEKIRSEAWNTTTGVALGAVVDSVADMVNTLPETPRDLRVRS